MAAPRLWVGEAARSRIKRLSPCSLPLKPLFVNFSWKLAHQTPLGNWSCQAVYAVEFGFFLFSFVISDDCEN